MTSLWLQVKKKLLSSVFIHRKVPMWRLQREADWDAREPSKRRNEWVVVVVDSSDYSMRKKPKHISVGWCRFGQTPSQHGFKGAIYKIPLNRKNKFWYVHELVTEWCHTSSVRVLLRPFVQVHVFKSLFPPSFGTSGPFSFSHYTNKQQSTDDANDITQ